MKFLIVGEGPEELAWAIAARDRPDGTIAAACPGLKAMTAVPETADLNAALATPGVEVAIIGGDPTFRAEALRRAAGEGLAIVALHPPGPTADPYYQVALSRAESGAVVVPDLPGRLHPGVSALAKAMADGSLGGLRSVRLEMSFPPASPDADLLRIAFPKFVDMIRSLLGEVEALTATGSPTEERPTDSLIVHLRGPSGRVGEVRLEAGGPARGRLEVVGSEGRLALEFEPGWDGPSRLIRTIGDWQRDGQPLEIPAWNSRWAILDALADLQAGIPARPDLDDGTKAVELAEAVGRSLRRRRTVELHYEEVSELGSFKGVMTGLGCGLLLLVPVLVIVALVGLQFGQDWMIYVAGAAPGLLVLFLGLQGLRFAARPSTPRAEPAPDPPGQGPGMSGPEAGGRG